MNIRSIVNKLSSFQTLIYSHDFDFIAITETWLSDNIFDNEILPTNYTIYRNDRGSRGGGVLLAVRDNIASKVLPSPTNIEMLTVEVELSQTLILCVVYLPPNPNVSLIQSLSSHLCQFDQSCNVVILGDFNLPDIVWDTLCGSTIAAEAFCDTCFENNLSQLISCSTHIHGNTLDLILTNNDDLIDNISVSDTINIPIKSDHYAITFELSSFQPQPTENISQYVYDFSKADFHGMNAYISNSIIVNCLFLSDVEAIWETIKSVIDEAMSLFIPKIQIRSKQYPKWFNRDLRHQLKCLHTMRKKHKRSPTEHNENRLNYAEGMFQQSVAAAKSNYETTLVTNFANSSNPAIYHHIRSFTKSATIPSTMHLDATSANSNISRANLFNQYFYSVFTPPSTTLRHTNITSHPNEINSLVFTEEEVFSVLSQLDPNKATGIDSISPKILKYCAASLTHPLCHLFNLSLASGVIPQEWKVHLVVPVYKSADRSSVKNYRPISLLCNTSKALETLIYNKIIDHVLNNVTTCQFGFLPKRSTTQQLLLYLNSIFKATSQGLQTDSIYLDFRKAFDSVSHSKLLAKLANYGISGNLWNWFSNYLYNRFQHVKVCNTISDPLPVLSGVPQGSILGPLLFLIYINDLTLATQFSNLFLFADDTKLFKTILHPPDHTKLQQDLDQLYTWSIDSDLLFGISKCIHLSFNNKSPTSYSLNGNTLPQLHSHRDLGIQISDNLSWECHYKHITSKAYRYLGLLRRAFSNCHSVKAKMTLYITLVRSQLTYCSQLWNPYLIKDTAALEKIQRQATKFILKDYESNYRTRLLKLDLLPLMYTLDFYDIMFLVKALKQPSNHFNIYEYISFSTVNTRSSSNNKLNHVFTSNNYTRNFYFNRISRLWNKLPSIDLSQPVSLIKANIYKYLHQHFILHFSADNPCTYHFCCRCSNCYNVGLSSNFSVL